MATTLVANLSDDPLASSTSHLTSSITSLSSSSTSSQNSKIYKQASNFFLTRRLRESYTTLETLISSPHTDSDQLDHDASDDSFREPAPIASASRGLRVKVWSLYISLVDEILKLGPEEGRATFGARQWRAFTAKTKDAAIWDEVVKVGYRGWEGGVDGEVVINLVTLLLSHSLSQQPTQRHLETYLASTPSPLHSSFSAPVRRFSSSRNSSPSSSTTVIHIPSNSPPNKKRSRASGASTPRALQTHVKILELYALHVLARVGELEYAREFVGASEVLDEDQRDEFLAVLQAIEDDEKEEDGGEDVVKEKIVEEARQPFVEEVIDDETADGRKDDDRAGDKTPTAASSNLTAKHQSITDISSKSFTSSSPTPTSSTPDDPSTSISSTSTSKSRPPTTSKPSSIPPTQRQRNAAASPAFPLRRSTTAPSTTATKRPPSTATAKPAPTTLLAKAHTFLSNLLTLAQTLSSSSPLALLRTVIFIASLLAAFSRREVRERVRRLLTTGWGKVRGTMIMGGRVSYI